MRSSLFSSLFTHGVFYDLQLLAGALIENDPIFDFYENGVTFWIEVVG